MKIGWIVPGFSADAADWCIPVLVDVVRELSRHVDLHVFALRYPYHRARYRVHGAQVHALGGAQTRGSRRAALLAAACNAIVAESRRGRFDALHGLWADEPGALAVSVGRLLRTPSVVSVMGGELVDIPDIHYGGRAVWTGRALTTLALRATTTLTAGCSNVVELARGFLPPCSHPKVAMLPWGIDQHALASGSQQVQLEGSFRILHVGSLIPVKDQHTLLQAIARLRSTEPGVHLHVVGQGPLRSSLEKLAARLGLVDAVTFHGHVVRHELPAFYRAADVFALSSRHEAQSVVVLEAGLNGLPIVGTSVGLVADFAPHAAVAVPVGDDAALANALTDLRQPAIRRRLGTAVRDLICSEYLASHTVDRLLSLYDRLE